MGTAYLLRRLSLITALSLLQQVRGWNISVPRTVTAVEGSCVVVPCQTEPHIRVAWYQYSTIGYPVVYDRYAPSVEAQFRGRTSVPGKPAEGNCTLLIRRVRTADNNLNVYVWINPDLKPSQKFHHQIVTIHVVRQTPKIFIQKQLIEGRVFQANCSIIHSCPLSTPSFKWTRSQFLENSSFTAYNNKENSQWMYTQILHGVATYEMHNSKMSCSAVFHGITINSQPVTLNILYKPVTVTVTVKSQSVGDGGGTIVECTANSNPQPHTYSWFKRQRGEATRISTAEGKLLLLNNITQKTYFSCLAQNDLGMQQSDWMDLDVQYAPVILPESSCNVTEEALRCVCQAEAFPDASIHWTIDGNDTLSSSFSFAFTNKNHVVTEEMSGPPVIPADVTCTATNSEGSDSKQLKLNSLQKPYAPVILPESSCHVTVEALKCVCHAEASPAASIYWTIDGNSTLSSSFSLASTNERNIVSGEISGPAQGLANIVCTATNSQGSNSRQLYTTTLQKSSSLFVWLPLMLMGIALLLGCAIFIYRKYYLPRFAPGYTCNTSIRLRPQSVAEDFQGEPRCQRPQSSAQDDDPQLSTTRPDGDPEEDGLFCVYDNDCVAEILQKKAEQCQNNTTAPQGEGDEDSEEKDAIYYKRDYKHTR